MRYLIAAAVILAAGFAGFILLLFAGAGRVQPITRLDLPDEYVDAEFAALTAPLEEYPFDQEVQ